MAKKAKEEIKAKADKTVRNKRNVKTPEEDRVHLMDLQKPVDPIHEGQKFQKAHSKHNKNWNGAEKVPNDLSGQGRGASELPVNDKMTPADRLPTDEKFTFEQILSSEELKKQAEALGKAGKSFIGVDSKLLDPKDYNQTLKNTDVKLENKNDQSKEKRS